MMDVALLLQHQLYAFGKRFLKIVLSKEEGCEEEAKNEKGAEVDTASFALHGGGRHDEGGGQIGEEQSDECGEGRTKNKPDDGGKVPVTVANPAAMRNKIECEIKPAENKRTDKWWQNKIGQAMRSGRNQKITPYAQDYYNNSTNSSKSQQCYWQFTVQAIVDGEKKEREYKNNGKNKNNPGKRMVGREVGDGIYAEK